MAQSPGVHYAMAATQLAKIPALRLPFYARVMAVPSAWRERELETIRAETKQAGDTKRVGS